MLEVRDLTVPCSHDLTALLDRLPADLVGECVFDDAVRLSDLGVSPHYPIRTYGAASRTVAQPREKGGGARLAQRVNSRPNLAASRRAVPV